MDSFLDKFFVIFHLLLTLFGIIGWIWRRTRKYHLYWMVLVAFSWLFLGIWYGLGYCPLTEWHWHIRYRLGKTDMPHSYIKFLIDTITGLNWNAKIVDIGTGIIFTLSFSISIILNLRDKIHKKRRFA